MEISLFKTHSNALQHNTKKKQKNPFSIGMLALSVCFFYSDTIKKNRPHVIWLQNLLHMCVSVYFCKNKWMYTHKMYLRFKSIRFCINSVHLRIIMQNYTILRDPFMSLSSFKRPSVLNVLAAHSSCKSEYLNSNDVAYIKYKF